MPRTIEARLVLAVLTYAALQVVLRLLIGPSLELDEAEAFYQARRLAWGYGPQPPLYFWMQWALFQVLGEGLLALALLKALILAGTVLALFALLRPEAGTGPAAIAALSLSLLPQVTWEGQRALTHSMLALLMAVIAAGLFTRALKKGRWRDYLALGAALGLGVLSKFNFVLWPLGLLAAAALLPEWRTRLRPLRLLASLAVALAVLAPVALWMARNAEVATGSVHKLQMEGGELVARILGIGDLLLAAASFLGLAILVLGGMSLSGAGGGRLSAVARLLAASSGLSVLILWAGLLASGATEVAERWLLPLAWGAVPAAVLWLWPGLGGVGRQALAGTVGGLWLLVVPLLPYASLVDPGYRGADFGPLIRELRDRGIGARPLEVESQWVAGNLVYLAPDLSPELWRPEQALASESLLVLEDASWEQGTAAGPGITQSTVTVAIPRGRRTLNVIVAETAW